MVRAPVAPLTLPPFTPPLSIEREPMRGSIDRGAPSVNAAGCGKRSGASSAALDQLDLVARGILDERDDRRAVLHRPGLARDLVTEGADAIACALDVVRPQRHVTVAVTQVVRRDAPVVRELDDG